MPRTMTRRFYVASEQIVQAVENGSSTTRHGWPIGTYSEAEAHAKELLDDSDKEIVYIAEIVAVVRKKNPKPPIVIEKVRR